MGKRHTAGDEDRAVVITSPSPTALCGACKFFRRKCPPGCIFAPHFGFDQGTTRFAAIHKVFGASNVYKLLLHIPVNRRHDAVVTISYQAQARLSDPVYGCVSTILALQQQVFFFGSFIHLGGAVFLFVSQELNFFGSFHVGGYLFVSQVASLQAELAMVQTQLINSRLAMANALQSSSSSSSSQQMAVFQPAYSNNSAASNNLINSWTFTSNFDIASETDPSFHSLEPLQPSQPSHDEDKDENE